MTTTADCETRTELKAEQRLGAFSTTDIIFCSAFQSAGLHNDLPQTSGAWSVSQAEVGVWFAPHHHAPHLSPFPPPPPAPLPLLPPRQLLHRALPDHHLPRIAAGCPGRSVVKRLQDYFKFIL